MRVTEAEIKKLIHQSNLIEGYDLKIADDHSLTAWRRLLSVELKDLSHYDIAKTQELITFFQNDLKPEDRGHYRKVPVWIGGEKLLNHGLLAPLMDNWINELKDKDPIAAHIAFEKIHPFIDGNGRTGRMLLWWHQMRLDQPISDITFADRFSYYDWFK